MKVMRKIINKVLCFTFLANICCNPVNAADIKICDYRFVKNTSIIEHIKSCVNFSGPSFQSLWSTGRKGESSEHLAIDTDCMAYTVKLSPTLTADEIYISAPIIDSASGSKMVGEILLTVPYGHNERLQDVMNELCFTNDLPDRFTQIGKQHIQYFLNASDAPTELPAEYNEIKNLSEFETKKDELEAATVIVEEDDKKVLGTKLSNINKILLVNVIKADE